MGFFKQLKEAWLASVTFDKLDDEFYDQLEEALILADMGVESATDAVAKLRKKVKERLLTRADEVKDALRAILAEKLEVGDAALNLSTTPSIVLFIGVNGVGKTTSIGKLAAQLKAEGKKVLLCAGDTFRAAAADQLEIWAERAGCEIVRQYEGADPGAVLFDALQAAKARNVDVVLCDTAGRLHIDENMMDEIAAVKQAVNPAETLLVVDAMTGQDAVNVASSFNEKLGITGVILTKLDGDTRGGAALSVKAVTGRPIKFAGTGEKLDDIEVFHPDRMASRILGMGDVLTLIEDAQNKMDAEKAEEMAQKMMSNKFDFNDLYDQFEQVKKMGPLKGILSKIPCRKTA